MCLLEDKMSPVSWKPQGCKRSVKEVRKFFPRPPSYRESSSWHVRCARNMLNDPQPTQAIRENPPGGVWVGCQLQPLDLEIQPSAPENSVTQLPPAHVQYSSGIGCRHPGRKVQIRGVAHVASNAKQLISRGFTGFQSSNTMKKPVLHEVKGERYFLGEPMT